MKEWQKVLAFINQLLSVLCLILTFTYYNTGKEYFIMAFCTLFFAIMSRKGGAE